MAHTPGPWYSAEYANYWVLQNEDSYDGIDILNEELCADAEANAHLAAAAPDLLDALINVFEHAKVIINSNHADYKAAEAAIKKATQTI